MADSGCPLLNEVAMQEIILEWFVCAFVAVVLMIVHELSKAAVYMGIQRVKGSKRVYSHSIWAVHRYIDPIALLLSVTSNVTFSKPFMFRIQDKRVNRILGITGFSVLLLCFGGSMAAIKLHAFGLSGMTVLEGRGLPVKVVALCIQYMAILSLGMLLTNLFPVSTFDMGLLIAGASAKKYLGIIKMDAVIKLIFVVTLFLNLIYYGSYRLINLLL